MKIFRNNCKSILIIIILVATMIFILLPIFYTFVYSGFNNYENNKLNNQVLFQNWSWKNYQKVFNLGYWNALIFSFIFVFLLVAFRLFICGIAGYALSKKDLKYKKFIITLLIFLAIIPESGLYLGLLIKIQKWHLNQSFLLFIGLIAPNIFSIFTILIFQDAYKNISDNQRKLIKIDQLSWWQKISLIFWPKLKYAIIFTTVITTISAWNSYLWPMIMLPQDQHTLSTLVFSISNLKNGSIIYNTRLAGAVLHILPVIIFYALFHQKIIKTFTAL